MSKPVAIGPTSRTVIGGDSDSPSVASIVNPKPVKKPIWKQYLVPFVLVSVAGYIVYKGKI